MATQLSLLVQAVHCATQAPSHAPVSSCTSSEAQAAVKV